LPLNIFCPTIKKNRMLADFYILRLYNDMKIAVQKNHLVGQIWHRSLDPVKKRRSWSFMNRNVYIFVPRDSALTNSVINPFIYFSVSELFQRELTRICCRHSRCPRPGTSNNYFNLEYFSGNDKRKFKKGSLKNDRNLKKKFEIWKKVQI